jgi:glutamate-1-semialdehyde 2,1-aminomutase
MIVSEKKSRLHDKNAKGMEVSNALYERALKTIPLATQTFSKAAQQYVSGVSPLFLKRGEGCRVWDVDGNEYIDFVLGLLPIVLGYQDKDVDNAIRQQLDNGIVFSLATELEAELAERLVRIIPCAEKVRFGKNGSDATLAATRLARAHTGRDKIAMCGYHGWHDWSIGTTTRNLGIPQAVRDLTITFPFNDIDALKVLLEENKDQFAAVIMEPASATDPEPGYLESVKELTHSHGALLVFDEIITGFRADLGGAQTYYGVTPDIGCFGKAMANGMPLSAVVGRADVMDLMEDIFFSATFGGETLSLAASIATLKKLEKEDVLPKMETTSIRLANGVKEIFAAHKIDRFFQISGPDWWKRITPIPSNNIETVILTSLLRQEMLANGLLMMSSFNICLAHCNDEVVVSVFQKFDRIASTLNTALSSGSPTTFLHGAPIRPVFQVRES